MLEITRLELNLYEERPSAAVVRECCWSNRIPVERIQGHPKARGVIGRQFVVELWGFIEYDSEARQKYKDRR